MSTAAQIKAQAAAALGAASSLTVASENIAPANAVQPAPTATAAAPGATTTDAVQPAPTISQADRIAQLEAQLAQALGVIATIRPAAVAAVEGERTYHSSQPFVRIHVMKGPGISEAFQFKGGKLITADPHAIAWIEAAIAAGDTGFAHAPVSKKPSLEEMEMRSDVLKAAVTARDKMVKAGEAVA